tara:strand:- start:98 stop:217 length:120 start_codon:yes stop_codon:yes gene_type:complete
VSAKSRIDALKRTRARVTSIERGVKPAWVIEASSQKDLT